MVGIAPLVIHLGLWSAGRAPALLLPRPSTVVFVNGAIARIIPKNATVILEIILLPRGMQLVALAFERQNGIREQEFTWNGVERGQS